MINAFKNTVQKYYPAYLRKAILKAVVDEDLAINNKKNDANQISLNLNDKIDVSDDETLDDKISHLLQDNEICAYIEEYEYKKAYKHFCYYFFESFHVEKIKELVDNDLVNVFDRKKAFPIDDFEKPTVYSTGDIIYLKFSYKLRNLEGLEIKYVMLATLDLDNSVLEIQFDRVGYGFKDSASFYKDKIDRLLYWLRRKLDIEIKNIDFKAVVDYMIRADKDISVVAQRMTRNGTTAYLEADENDDTIPILGELDRFIEENEELFNKNEDTLKIKKQLENFRNDIIVKSDLPKVTIRFDDSGTKVGITHNYLNTDYSLFMLYGELLLEKEVMGNVREFLIECHRELNSVAPSLSIPSSQN